MNCVQNIAVNSVLLDFYLKMNELAKRANKGGVHDDDVVRRSIDAKGAFPGPQSGKHLRANVGLCLWPPMYIIYC